jgi:RNA polymerase sigma factor (sigma-70 family)
VIQDAEHGVGDVGQLYCSLSPQLERIVRLDVNASDALIEDACQFAWSRLVHHRQRVQRECALSWLARTAVHEALKLIRRQSRELSLDEAAEQVNDGAATPLAPSPDEVVEQIERLDTLRALPERQQRLLWLQGLGLSYAEMARHEGCTERTVERHLLHARREIRRAAAAEG